MKLFFFTLAVVGFFFVMVHQDEIMEAIESGREEPEQEYVLILYYGSLLD